MIMNQGDLFRDEGISQAERNADFGWMEQATIGVKRMAETFDTFTTDNVWKWMDNVSRSATHDNRAMGAVMRKAQKEGWIEPTDRVVKSTRPVCHSRPIRVWRSKLI